MEIFLSSSKQAFFRGPGKRVSSEASVQVKAFCGRVVIGQ